VVAVEIMLFPRPADPPASTSGTFDSVLDLLKENELEKEYLQRGKLVNDKRKKRKRRKKMV
jgi:hypothetical protein